MATIRPATFKFVPENQDAIAELNRLVSSTDRLEISFSFRPPYNNTNGEIPSHVYRAELQRAIDLKHGGVALKIMGLADWCKRANEMTRQNYQRQGLAPVLTHVEFETSDLASRMPALTDYLRLGWI